MAALASTSPDGEADEIRDIKRVYFDDNGHEMQAYFTIITGLNGKTSTDKNVLEYQGNPYVAAWLSSIGFTSYDQFLMQLPSLARLREKKYDLAVQVIHGLTKYEYILPLGMMNNMNGILGIELWNIIKEKIIEDEHDEDIPVEEV